MATTTIELTSTDTSSHPPSHRFPSASRVQESLDIESAVLPREQSAVFPDPLQLSSAIKSPAEIERIILAKKQGEDARNSNNLTRSRIPFADRLRRKSSSSGGDGASGRRGGRISIESRPSNSTKRRDVKELQSFYETQNAHIQRMLKSVEEHRSDAREEQGSTRLKYQIAVHGSLLANVLLALLQIYAAVGSGSLSLFATMADAVFDPLSNLVLLLCHRAVNKVDPNRFPSGKARLETAGNMGFASLMMMVSVILIIMSVRELTGGSPAQTTKFHLPSVIVVGIALTVKFILFLYCFSLKDTYSQVAIVWRDHRNDLPVNAFGLITSIGGSKLAWYIDPMGAILIGVLILLLWGRVVYREALLLIGLTAPQEIRGLITYIAMTHDDKITHIDTVRAYHSGPRLIVEVDVVMNESTPLREAHDVSEALQIKLESLPDVERAYVHVDYEAEHKPEHFLKKEL